MYLKICFKDKKIQDLKYKDSLLENKERIFLKLGNIYNLNNEKIDLKKIEDLYLFHGSKIYNYLDGIYTLIIIDYKENKISIYQDYFGSNQCIYYFIDENNIYISNEMKEIILNTKSNWELEKKSVKEFLIKGYVTNSNTLVKNINKIPSKKYFEVDLIRKKIRLKNYKNIINKKIKNINKTVYNDILKDACLSSIDNDIALTISSGYDSNYLLYILNKYTNTRKKINAFCIGGKIGRNEIPDAKKICSNYNNVIFFSRLVDGSSFEKYPEIVWILEGAIYEVGIFLQYELSKMVKQEKIDNIILGECADQVLHYELYNKKLAIINKFIYNFKKIIKKLISGVNIKPYKDVYEMASYKVIKKNGIIMNYFDINTKYPYLRKKFVNIAKSVVKIGDTKKQYHKKIINDILPKNITSILKKIGGATELKTLFIGNVKFEDIKKICKKSIFYKKKKFNDEFYEIDYYMKILYIELFKKIFLNNDIKMFFNCDFNEYKLNYFFPELNDT